MFAPRRRKIEGLKRMRKKRMQQIGDIKGNIIYRKWQLDVRARLRRIVWEINEVRSLGTGNSEQMKTSHIIIMLL